jgi:uncharacterized membrane protein YkoI
MSLPLIGFVLALALLAAGVDGARADGDSSEQDEAHRAVQRGAIRPLNEILGRLPPGVAGEIVRVKLVQREGQWVYELRRVDSRGRLSEIVVDAATGAEMGEDDD